jgi:hypothetical protein
MSTACGPARVPGGPGLWVVVWGCAGLWAASGCVECSAEEVREGNSCVRTCNNDEDCRRDAHCEEGRCRAGAPVPVAGSSSHQAPTSTPSGTVPSSSDSVAVSSCSSLASGQVSSSRGPPSSSRPPPCGTNAECADTCVAGAGPLLNACFTGVRAYYRFEESPVQDSSPGGRHATSGDITRGPGVVGQAATFAPGTPLVSLPPDLLLGLAQGTVAFWVRLDVPGDATLLHQGATDPCGTGGHVSVRTDALGRVSLSLDHPAGNAAVRAHAALVAGRWTHVALTFSTNRASLYLDGSLDGPAVSRNSLFTVETSLAGPLWLGGPPGGTPFTGALDELVLFHRELTADEVFALYAATVAGGPACGDRECPDHCLGNVLHYAGRCLDGRCGWGRMSCGALCVAGSCQLARDPCAWSAPLCESACEGPVLAHRYGLASLEACGAWCGTLSAGACAAFLDPGCPGSGSCTCASTLGVAPRPGALTSCVSTCP